MRNASRESAHVWLVLVKATQAISRLAATHFMEASLGESDFRVLEALLHKGALPVNAIGPKVNLTPGAISIAVDRLHCRGLVSRVENPEDRRCRIVDLTPAGRAAIVPVFRQHAAVIERVLEVLSRDERTQLERLLKKIGRHAEALALDTTRVPSG